MGASGEARPHPVQMIGCPRTWRACRSVPRAESALRTVRVAHPTCSGSASRAGAAAGEPFNGSKGASRAGAAARRAVQRIGKVRAEPGRRRGEPLQRNREVRAEPGRRARRGGSTDRGRCEPSRGGGRGERFNGSGEDASRAGARARRAVQRIDKVRASRGGAAEASGSTGSGRWRAERAAGEASRSNDSGASAIRSDDEGREWRDLSEARSSRRRASSREIFNLRFQLSTGWPEPVALSQRERSGAGQHRAPRAEGRIPWVSRKSGRRVVCVRRDAEDAGGEDRAGVPPSPLPARHPDVKQLKAHDENNESRVAIGSSSRDRPISKEKRWRIRKFWPRVLTDDPTRSMLDVADNSGQEGPSCIPGDGRR